MVKQNPKFKPMRGLAWVTRSQFTTEYAGHRYTIDVDFFDWTTQVNLFKDQQWVFSDVTKMKHEIQPGVSVDVLTSSYGMRHARIVESHPDGDIVHDFDPAEKTAEAWRARLDKEKPQISRIISAVSWTVLLIVLITQVPNWFNLVMELTAEFDNLPTIDMRVPALTLPDNLNSWLTVAGVVALVERALRLKYKFWLDGLAG